MRAAPRDTEPVADLSNRQAARLCSEQLEDIQRPIGGFHGRDPHRSHQPPGRAKDTTQCSAGATGDASVTGGKSSHSQTMIVTLPLAKFGTSARAAAISLVSSAASRAAASSK